MPRPSHSHYIQDRWYREGDGRRLALRSADTPVPSVRPKRAPHCTARHGPVDVSNRNLRTGSVPDMSPRLPPDCTDLSHVRTEIDRLDKALVDLIGERFSYVERAWQIKLTQNAEANVPWRNQQVIDRVRARATERGVPPELCEALWRQMIGWFIQYEEEKLRPDLEAQAANKS